MAKRPSSEELLSLFGATIAAEGVTTAAGAAAGTSLIDAALIAAGANSFDGMLAVVYPDSPLEIDSFDIVGFVPATGEVQLNHAYKGVAAAIPIGVPYKIVSFRFVPAEVAALMADVGDASGSALGSLYGILGNPAQTFLAMIGYEGATALANKLTAARAALLDQITALRMAELDPANIPADVDTLLARLTAARAGYLNELDFDLQGTLATIAAYIDTEIAALVAAGIAVTGAVSDAGPAAADFDTDLAEATDDHYNGMLLMFLDGDCAGQAHVIDDYAAVNGNVAFSVEDRWTDVPGDGDDFIIIPAAGLIAKAIYGRLGAPAGASMSADIAAIEAHCSYLEQIVPVQMNCTQTLTNVAADKDFLASNVRSASGLISTDNTKVQKVFLLIIGRAVNTFDGDNALDCTTAAHNQWRQNLDGGGYQDLLNEGPDGQMLDNDWRCHGKGIIHPFTLMFNASLLMDNNIDGKIGLRLENGRAEQDGLIVTCDIYLRILWKL